MRSADLPSPLPSIQTQIRAPDPLTELPWSVELRAEISRLAADHQVHAIFTWLAGLEDLINAHGARVAHVCFGHIVRRIARRLDDRDRLTRHFAGGLLIITTRLPEEIVALSASISHDVAEAAIDVRGTPTPDARVGVATMAPMTDSLGSFPAFDVVMMSLEAIAIKGNPKSSPIERDMIRKERLDRRMVLENVTIEIVEGTVRVSCALALGERRVAATSAGRNGETARLMLVADAAAQAITKLLPGSHGIAVRTIRLTGERADEGVWVALDYVTPSERGSLHGTAPVRSDRYSAAARAVLSAVNRYVARAR